MPQRPEIAQMFAVSITIRVPKGGKRVTEAQVNREVRRLLQGFSYGAVSGGEAVEYSDAMKQQVFEYEAQKAESQTEVKASHAG